MEVRVLGEIEEVIGVGFDHEIGKVWIRVRLQGSSDALQLNLPMEQFVVLAEKTAAATEAAERELESSDGGQ